MKLKVTKRSTGKKSEAKEIRLVGHIPAVIYVKGKSGENIVVNAVEFDAIVRNVKQGRLSTTKLTLVDENGNERPVFIKDIQYNRTNYNVIHLDFEELHDDVKVNVNVPIECIGVVECVGIKLGGVLRQVIRYLKVRCLPKDIPDVLELDVRNLGIRETKRLIDLDIPPDVRPLANLNEVAVAIVKR